MCYIRSRCLGRSAEAQLSSDSPNCRVSRRVRFLSRQFIQFEQFTLGVEKKLFFVLRLNFNAIEPRKCFIIFSFDEKVHNQLVKVLNKFLVCELWFSLVWQLSEHITRMRLFMRFGALLALWVLLQTFYFLIVVVSCRSQNWSRDWKHLLNVCGHLCYQRQNTSALIIKRKIHPRASSVQGVFSFSTGSAATTGTFRREKHALDRIVVVCLSIC